MSPWLVGLVLAVGLGAILLIAAYVNAPGIPVLLPAIGGAAVAVLIAYVRLWRRPAVIACAILLWFAFHKLVVALAAPGMSETEVSLVYNFKEWLYVGLFMTGVAMVAVAHRPWQSGVRRLLGALNWADRFAMAFVALVSLYFAVGLVLQPERLEGSLVYARRFASLPLIYLAGRMLLAKRHEFQLSIRALVGVAIVVAGFGLIERLVLGDRFWTDIVGVDDLHATLVSSGFASDRTRLIDGLPANWISYLDGITVRRLVSSFLEPTTLSIFLSLALLVAAFASGGWRRLSPWGWRIGCLLLGGAMLLTIGKGGMLIAAIAAVVFFVRPTRRNVVAVVVPIGVLVLVLIFAAQWMPFEGNVRRHLAGLASGIAQLVTHPLGSGLGSTGFWGVARRVGTDSSIGAIAAQVGLLGAGLFCAWLMSLAWRLFASERADRRLRNVRTVFAGAISGFFVLTFLSDSATGLLAGSFFVLLGGWLVSVQDVAHASSAAVRPGLVLGWMPASRRSESLAKRLGFELKLLGRPGFRRPWTAFLAYPWLALQTLAVLFDRRPQAIVVVAPPFVAPLIVVPFAKLIRARVAVDIHSGALLDRRWRWSLPLLRLTTRLADASIVTLDSLSPHLRGVASRPLVIPDPLPSLELRSPVVATASTVVAICGWGDDEPIDQLVEAARGQGWRLRITGRPRRSLDLPPNVELTGFLSEADYAACLAEASVVVALTTRGDTLLSGAWEALALRRPLLVSSTEALIATFGPDVASLEPDAESIRAGINRVLAEPRAAEAAVAELSRHFAVANDRALDTLRLRLLPPPSHEREATAAE